GRCSLDFLIFLFYGYVAPRDLHSFPTRRSSDLSGEPALRAGGGSPALRDGGRGARLRGRGLRRCAGGVWAAGCAPAGRRRSRPPDRKSTRLNSSHVKISYAVFCLKKKNDQLTRE